MFRFEQLEIWKLAVEYGKRCHKITTTFPRYEQYGLGDQLRRAGLSISNNIAEGSVGSTQNFRKYIITAIGSALESVNIVNFAKEIHYLDESIRLAMYEEAEKLIRKMRNFSKSLQ